MGEHLRGWHSRARGRRLLQVCQEFLHEQDYHLLLTDNQMPRLTGLELIRKLRSAGMTLPVILVSGTVRCENPRSISSRQPVTDPATA